MFSTVRNVENLLSNVENMWQSGIFAWKNQAVHMENTWKKRSELGKTAASLALIGFVMK